MLHAQREPEHANTKLVLSKAASVQPFTRSHRIRKSLSLSSSVYPLSDDFAFAAPYDFACVPPYSDCRQALDICIMYVYALSMQVVWDPRKAASNQRKHGIRFSDAEAVLFDPFALTREDSQARGEQRFVSMGTDSSGRIVVIVYSYRGQTIRLISARTATRSERKNYEEGI